MIYSLRVILKGYKGWEFVIQTIWFVVWSVRIHVHVLGVKLTIVCKSSLKTILSEVPSLWILNWKHCYSYRDTFFVGFLVNQNGNGHVFKLNYFLTNHDSCTMLHQISVCLVLAFLCLFLLACWLKPCTRIICNTLYIRAYLCVNCECKQYTVSTVHIHVLCIFLLGCVEKPNHMLASRACKTRDRLSPVFFSSLEVQPEATVKAVICMDFNIVDRFSWVLLGILCMLTSYTQSYMYM